MLVILPAADIEPLIVVVLLVLAPMLILVVPVVPPVPMLTVLVLALPPTVATTPVPILTVLVPGARPSVIVPAEALLLCPPIVKVPEVWLIRIELVPDAVPFKKKLLLVENPELLAIKQLGTLIDDVSKEATYNVVLLLPILAVLVPAPTAPEPMTSSFFLKTWLLLGLAFLPIYTQSSPTLVNVAAL